MQQSNSRRGHKSGELRLGESASFTRGARYDLEKVRVEQSGSKSAKTEPRCTMDGGSRIAAWPLRHQHSQWRIPDKTDAPRRIGLKSTRNIRNQHCTFETAAMKKNKTHPGHPWKTRNSSTRTQEVIPPVHRPWSSPQSRPNAAS